MFKLLQVKEKVLREGEFFGIIKLGERNVDLEVEAEEKRQKFLLKYFTADILAIIFCNLLTVFIYIYKVQYCNIIHIYNTKYNSCTKNPSPNFVAARIPNGC